MKKTLEKGENKIQEICDILRHKTLEPAKNEAQSIIEAAKKKAEQIIHNAEMHAEQIIKDGKRSIEQERNVFQSSLAQASKQALESLRNDIENKLFNQELQNTIVQHTTDPKIIAKLISTIVAAIEKDGLNSDLTAIIPKEVPAKEVAQYLGSIIINKLKGGIIVGNFAGGAKVRLDDKKIIFDISSPEIEDLVRNYVRKDFRQIIFENQKLEA